MSDRWFKYVDGRKFGIDITEAEPGLVHITTEAVHELLRLGEFTPSTTEKENPNA